MFSTHDNLNNPMKKDWLVLEPSVETWRTPPLVTLSQMEYNLMGTHDPLTYYHTLGADGKHHIYFGDHEMSVDKNSCKYLMGPTDHDCYSIYLVLTNCGSSALFEIARFRDVQDAVKALVQWNQNLYKPVPMEDICETIRNYKDDVISCNEFIISIISMFGYRSDPRLQDVINVMATYDDDPAYRRHLSAFAQSQIDHNRKNPKNRLFAKYAAIYDLMVATLSFDALNLNIENYAHKITEIMMDQ